MRTHIGQLVFFAEFLDVAGVFERWVEACPLDYSSGYASACRDVLGKWMLSVLDGHCRYAHIAGLRGDGVAPEIPGMEKIISDEALRRALKAIAPAPDSKHLAYHDARRNKPCQSAGCQCTDGSCYDSINYATIHLCGQVDRNSNVNSARNKKYVFLLYATKQNWRVRFSMPYT